MFAALIGEEMKTNDACYGGRGVGVLFSGGWGNIKLKATGGPKRRLVPGFPVTHIYIYVFFRNSKNTWLG